MREIELEREKNNLQKENERKSGVLGAKARQALQFFYQNINCN